MRVKLYRGWWYAVWRDGGQTHRRALRTQDRDEAARALLDYRRELERPRDTIAGIYAAYLDDKGTDRARWAWKPLQPAWGALRPDQATKVASREYVARRRAQGAGDGTIHTELTYLRAALRWHSAAMGGDIELPSKPPPNSRHLTRAEYEMLLAATDTPHVRLFILLALATAGRMTAILGLTWDRIDLARGIIALGDGRKMRKGRATVPITDRARAALEEAHAGRTSDFVIEYGGEQVGKIRKAFARAAAKAGLEWVTPHALRHTAAVWMAEADVPMEVIAQYLGHSDSRITERVYARFTPAYLRKASRALE